MNLTNGCLIKESITSNGGMFLQLIITNSMDELIDGLFRVVNSPVILLSETLLILVKNL